MQGWLTGWDAAMPMTTSSDMRHGMGRGDMSSPTGTDDFGMGDMMRMSEADMTALQAATGVHFVRP
jgi:hypothetical protein